MRIATVLAALMLAAPASAQTIRVTINQATKDEIIREVNRIVQSTLPVTGDVIRDAIHEITSHAGAAAHLDARQSRSFRAEKTDRETRTLAIGAAGALDLDTRSGDITVTAGTGRDVSLEIIRRSRGKTDADVQQGLDQVKVNVDQRPERARVRAVFPDKSPENYNVDVSYVITAPAGTHVTAVTIAGKISIKGIRGDVTADITSGHIDITGSRVSQVKTIAGPVTLTDIETDGTLDARTVSGTVTLQNVKARRVTSDAVATGDVIATNVTAEAVTLKALAGNVSFTGSLAKNGRYELSAFSGSVRFNPGAPVGFELQVSTFSGDIHSDSSMTLRGLSMTRRSLTGTMGDGSAVVILKTFSGSVTIGKTQ